MIAHQRHVLFRGHLDFAPVLCVFFPLVFFAFFLNWMVMPQGTRLQLPSGTGVNHLDPGEPVFMVAVDSGERLFFENQFMSVADFQSRLQKRAAMP